KGHGVGQGALLHNLSDHSAGIARGEYARRNVSSHDAPSSDDRSLTDRDAGAKDRTATDPHVRTNLDRLAEFLLSPKLGIHWMRGGVNLHRGAKKRKVPDPDLADIQDHAVEIKKDPLAKQDIRAVV